jgi:hypothetical protein
MLEKIFIISLLVVNFSLAATVSVSGSTITNRILPLDAEKKVASGELKKGESSYGVFLGLVTFGNASIKAAAENGGIINILYVDQREATFSLFGTVSKYTTVVYGY